MIPAGVLVALAAVGISLAVSGVALIVKRARPSGLLLALGGVVLVGAGLLEATEHPAPSRTALVASLALLLPLGLATYPRASVRRPVDFLSLITLCGAGLQATLRWNAPGTLVAMGVLIAFVLIGHTWWRIESSEGREQRTLTWMALGVVVPGLIAGLVYFGGSSATGQLAAFGLYVLLGPAMYLGITRPEVVDVRGLVRQAVVYAEVAFVYLALVIGLAALLEILTGSPPGVGVTAILGLLVATTIPPLRVLLQGVMDDLLFGQRPDPLQAAIDVAGRVGTDPTPTLDAIREAMVLPFAALSVDGAIVGSSGSPVTHTRSIPLPVGTGSWGELRVGLRPGDLQLSTEDEQVLGLVAPLLVQMIRVAGLAAELQASREATITAQEEERRRLRNELHDGLGPRLSGIAYTADAARQALAVDPDTAAELLTSLRTETVTAIADIRRLVYGMRPPALDELGLVGALRQQTATMRTISGALLQVDVSATELPEPLSAAVEVAAYRIVVEAVANVGRHSGSETATVRLTGTKDLLVVQVSDRSTSARPWSPGIGIQSMTQRASELGGTLTARGGPDGGLVRAELPLTPARPRSLPAETGAAQS